MLQAFDKGSDMRLVLVGLLEDGAGEPNVDANNGIEVWLAINNLLDKRKLEEGFRDWLLGIERALTEQLIAAGRETHNFVLNKKKAVEQVGL